jgi:hypothetical protein
MKRGTTARRLREAADKQQIRTFSNHTYAARKELRRARGVLKNMQMDGDTAQDAAQAIRSAIEAIDAAEDAVARELKR